MIRTAIAEDDPNCAKQLEQFLREFGRESGHTFQITHYDNGENLIEQYRPNSDLIFLDIEMPFVDGLTAARPRYWPRKGTGSGLAIAWQAASMVLPAAFPYNGYLR